MKKFSEIFQEEYYERMLMPGHPMNPVRNRADNFLFIFQELEKIEAPLILETGCMRPDHGAFCFGDDGCSSYLFSEFAKLHGGSLFSVDLSQENVDFSNEKCGGPYADFTCEDSVEYILHLSKSGLKFDLLYLDSFDVEKDNPRPSQEHHLKELKAAKPLLKKGTIIVIDDHDAFFTVPPIGKGNLAKEELEEMGAKKLFENYQLGYVIQ